MVTDWLDWCGDRLAGLVWGQTGWTGVGTDWLDWCGDRLAGLVWGQIGWTGVGTDWLDWCGDRLAGLVWGQTGWTGVGTDWLDWCGDRLAGLVWGQTGWTGVGTVNEAIILLGSPLTVLAVVCCGRLAGCVLLCTACHLLPAGSSIGRGSEWLCPHISPCAP